MFKKYCSIENSYRQDFLDRIKGHGFWAETFVVQEKVHGSNFSFWTDDGIEFKGAKRSGYVEEGERFYNHSLILESIQHKLQGIWKDLKSDNQDLTQMAVFGEIFGGNYPHDEVRRDKKAIKVQKGIFYSPHNEFYAFDILINNATYLDVEVINELFERNNLVYAKTLFSGSLMDCLNYPNEFESTISAQLGLPEIKPNICEGVVIRPIKYLKFNNNTRVILKNKNEKWSEKIKYDKKIRKTEKLPEKIIKLQEVILTYVTENRLNNVISKIGEVSFDDFGKIIGMFTKDIVEDFKKDYSSILEDLDKKEIKYITKSFSKIAAGMIREKLKKG